MFMRSRISFITFAIALLLMLGALVMMVSSPAAAEVSLDGNFSYRHYQEGVEITAYLGAESVVVVPSDIDGNPVVSIGASAFASGTTLVPLTSVQIQADVRSIGDSAFYQSGATINIPATVQKIENNAFYGCTGLTAVAIPDGVTTIGSGAFQGCTNLNSLTLDGAISLSSVGSNAFASTAIQSVTIPDSVASIGTDAFNNDPALTQIAVGAGNSNYASIGGVLYNKAITTLIKYTAGKPGDFVVPDSVTNIVANSFLGCTGLQSVTVPSGVTNIGASAFSGCTALTRMEFKGNSPNMGANWASGATGLKVYYHSGASGFSGPSWNGITLVGLYGLTMSSNFGTTSVGGIFEEGAQVTITATAPTANSGENYVWSGWTGTGTGSYSGTDLTRVITVNADITEQAVWTKQYWVTVSSNPVTGGTTVPTAGPQWIDAGPLSIQASTSAGYSFSSWSSTGPITFNDQSSSTVATVSGPGTITAGFTVNSVEITITSTPTGAGYVLVDGNPIVTPWTGSWVPGEKHDLVATDSIGANEQYLFLSWSDTGARAHQYTMPMLSDTITASFNHQYLVTMNASFGTTTPSIGTHWYDAGTVLTIDATAPVASGGSQYVWKGWTGTGTGSYSGIDRPTSNVVVNGPITETAGFTKQYQVTFAVSPAGGGTITPAPGTQWIDAGPLSIQATPSAGYNFSSWSNNDGLTTFGDSQRSSTTTNIVGPVIITANFGPLPVSVTIRSSGSAATGYVLVDGVGITTPKSFVWTPGTNHTLEAVGNVSAGTGERYSFGSWSDGGARSHSYLVTTSPATVTASFSHQFALTMNANGGTTTPGAGILWVNASSKVTLNATAPPANAGSQYSWKGWTGTGSGSYTGASQLATNAVTMNGPITETAIWGLQYAVNISTNFGVTSPLAGISWFDAGSTITLTATAPAAGANERYLFNGWVGSGVIAYNGMDNPATNAVTVNGPINQTASWTLQRGPGMVTGLTAIAGDSMISLSWNAPSDSGMPVDGYVVFQDGVPVKSVTTLYATIVGLTNGQSYSFTVAAHNAIGNGQTPTAVSIKPIKGASTLILEITSPVTGSYNSTGSVILKWNITDFGSAVVKTEVSSEVSPWITVTGTSYVMGGLSEGPHTLYVRVTDAVNNEVTRLVPIIVDRSPPIVTAKTPTPGGYVNNQYVTFTWAINDTGSGLFSTEISTDGINWAVQLVAGKTSIYQDGSYKFYIRATDNAGNNVTAIIPFTVDTVLPTVVMKSPSGNAESTVVGINITFSESMNRASTIISVAGVGGAVVWSGSNSVSFMPVSALRGWTNYSVSVNGTDLAGNPITKSWTFRTALWGTISGVVHDYDGKPLANAVVKLIAIPTAAQNSSLSLAASTGIVKVLTTTSDAYGAYAFHDVTIGNYTLEVTAPGRQAKNTPVSMTMNDIRNGGLTVDPEASPAGMVDGLLFLIAIAAISAGLIGLVLMVRKRRNPPTKASILEFRDALPPTAEMQENQEKG
ncbi:MAG TPA: leucine-rich repeat protein [Methanomassiliicoccales archaeon]|jgi:hypothetical protein